MMVFAKEHRKILSALNDIDLKAGSKISTKYEIKNRHEAIERHPYLEYWAKDVKKGKAFDKETMRKFSENFENNGGRFYFANDGEEANRIILKIIGDGKIIVKSKSLVGEEIELRQFLEKNGKEVYETDLGEFLVQITNGRPAHMVTPAVNMTEERARIALEPYIGKKLDVVSMVMGVRYFMREKFFNADIGIIGANALAADTGSIIFITNEGNGALTSILPQKIIVVTSVEKIYSTLLDAIKEAYVQTAYDGYKSISYIHILNRPDATNREIHLILVDNGRSCARESFIGETLYCIKCGACQLSCPVFREIDGAWGHIYTAAIGIPWTFITGPKEKARDLSYFCLGCGKCKEVCPMNINIPEIIRKIKRGSNFY